MQSRYTILFCDCSIPIRIEKLGIRQGGALNLVQAKQANPKGLADGAGLQSQRLTT